ncbi:glycosyltransferase family 39 protein [Paenibacillus pasadenensis]|uniref:glycosyltransferase family 39 protein n=1 Tax=Paenibacillus pasadenensis TaxID=217090 RepID=UPI00203B7561|nr:glycosyltransferase family 39 protein [Paenibacillus pasadenensis]MCM3748132.1 glycosyltransferase family 39 protein [Paenibacillus pasadenensis]
MDDNRMIESEGRSRRHFTVDYWLAAAIAVAACLSLYGIWNEAYSNTYYTTAVGSMLQSWHNFFFGSLDSAGSVTVDKPPLVLWIQTAFAFVFGLHGWSVILPQALAFIATVPLIYLCVKPTFGTLAARCAAIAMALTPVAVSVARTNNMDAMVVFALVLAAWFLLRGIREQRTGSLIAAFALIGVAFNMKMLQAYMVLPAFFLLYVLGVRWLRTARKYSILAVCTGVMLLISVSWAVVVDAIPADKRPYIGSSETNSVLELAFGYNGVSRLTGDNIGGPNGTGTKIIDPGSGDAGQNGGGQLQENPPQGTNPSNEDGRMRMGGSGMDIEPGMPGDVAPMAGGMFGSGKKGPLRLFQSGLSGQASWLLPFALLSALALLISFRWRGMTAKHKEALFWLAWLIPVGAFFSVAGFMHEYYLIMLAPPIAALAGAGAAHMWSKYRESAGWQAWLLPVAVAVTGLFQWYILQAYEDTIGIGWSIAAAALGLLGALFLAAQNSDKRAGSRTIFALSLAVLLIGPAYWSATPIVYGQNSMIPKAGPGGGNGGMGMQFSVAEMGNGNGGRGGSQSNQWPSRNNGQDDGRTMPDGQQMTPPDGQMTPPDGQKTPPNGQQGLMRPVGNMTLGGPEAAAADKGLLEFLRSNQTTDYLLAVMDYSTAAPYIVKEKEKLVILQGFKSSDPVYDEAKLEELVRSGKVKYFLVRDFIRSAAGRGTGSDKLTGWIKKHGKPVDKSQYSSGNGESAGSGEAVLYEVTLD